MTSLTRKKTSHNVAFINSPGLTPMHYNIICYHQEPHHSQEPQIDRNVYNSTCLVTNIMNLWRLDLGSLTDAILVSTAARKLKFEQRQQSLWWNWGGTIWNSTDTHTKWAIEAIIICNRRLHSQLHFTKKLKETNKYKKLSGWFNFTNATQWRDLFCVFF